MTNPQNKSTTLKAAGRIYYFNITASEQEVPCLTIAEEGKRKGETDSFKNILTIMQVDIQPFVEKMGEALQSINKPSGEPSPYQIQYTASTSVKLTTDSRSYFFDIRTAKNNAKFLTISETQKTTGTDHFQRNSVLVFERNLPAFVAKLNEVLGALSGVAA